MSKMKDFIAGLPKAELHLHIEGTLEPDAEQSSWTRVSARLGIAGGDNRWSVMAIGRNLTDDEQRFQASFIGNLAPQPGRTIEVGLRLAF